MSKEFALEDFCEPLMESPTYLSKKMFGGLAIYHHSLMVLVLTESEGDREWRGQEFDFDLWNGVLVCTSREHHASLKKEFPSLQDHPILGKWLFLPMLDSKFEATFETLIKSIELKDDRIGIVPGTRKRKKKSKKRKKATKKVSDKVSLKKKASKKKRKKRQSP